MPQPRAGDLFALPLPNSRYLTGRVLLNVSHALKIIRARCALSFFADTVLVEVYKNISTTPSTSLAEVLIPGIFVGMDLFSVQGKERWSIIGHVPVDPRCVEFPEALSGGRNSVMFVRGELELPVSVGKEALDHFNCWPSINPEHGLAYKCLYYLGLKHLIDSSYADNMHLRMSDLRFTGYRDEVYRLLGEDPKQSYYDMALRHGYDLARLYR